MSKNEFVQKDFVSLITLQMCCESTTNLHQHYKSIKTYCLPVGYVLS